MGQQQLLLIVLGVLIVGLAIYGGTRFFAAFNQENERDLIIQQMSVLAGEARKFAARPRYMGGGEGSFEGFSPPARMAETDRVTINVTSGADWVLFQGYGSVVGIDGSSPVLVVGQYELSSETWSTLETVN